MTIEIIESVFIEEDNFFACWLEITDGLDTYITPATAPGATADLQIHFDAIEAQIWQVAEENAIEPDSIFTTTSAQRVVKGFALAVLDEINILRSEAALPDRTIEQLRQVIKEKLQVLV